VPQQRRQWCSTIKGNPQEQNRATATCNLIPVIVRVTGVPNGLQNAIKLGALETGNWWQL
jgi:hypothetical protein